MKKNLSYWLLILLIVIPGVLQGQSFDFKIYNTSEGLADNDIIALAQDKYDYVWMATDEGLIRYDGIEYNVYTTADSLAHNYINCLFFDKMDRLWIGHKNGLISYMENDQFYKVAVEGASQLISDINQDAHRNIWAIDQKRGLIKISPDGVVTTFFDRKKFGRKSYTALHVLSPTRMLIGTAKRGLFVFEFDDDYKDATVTKIADIPNVWINTIVKSKKENKYWIGTRGKGFYSYYETEDNKGVSHISDNNLCQKFNIEAEEITDIYEEAEGHLLVSTVGSGVVRLVYDPAQGIFNDSFKYSSHNGLSNNDVQDILCDREGNYWFGTKGGGVSLLVNQYFVFYNLDEIGFHYKARSVLKDGEQLWVGLDRGLILTDPMCFDVRYFDAQYGGIPNDEIVDIYKSNDGTIWIASANSGLYYKSKNAQSFKKRTYFNDQLALKINGISGYEHYLLLATQRGLVIINLKTSHIKNYEIKDGLSHNNINFVYVDSKNNIWVGPKDGGLCKINPNLNRIERHPVKENVAVDVTGMSEDKDGQLWISTKGEGVICYSNDAIKKQITTTDGLKKDFCYGIYRDIKNRLWVCHDGGLSRIEIESTKSTKEDFVKAYGHNEELGDEFFQVRTDDVGGVWFVSNKGVVNYLPENDRLNNVAPILNITGIFINDEEVEVSNKLDLKFPYGKNSYKFKVDFRAISFKNPEGVTYQVKIEKEGDDEAGKWANLGNVSHKEIDYLAYGTYKIKIRAFNSDGKETSLLRTINVNIAAPFWSAWWFYVLLICFVILAFLVLIKYRERALIRQKQKLQKEVASQTVVLREQKAEIERKNRDITDSINYAKKIQSSILPSMDDLMTIFPESFVYFLPRDIVSGDFYWFNRSKDYFIACCADCTGHGVPGAFMSMIGTTILNDIFRIPEIDSPAAMLERLDEEVKKLLQKTEGNESMDGMDISIVEVHIPTRRIRLASAKRPVYLIINDEMTVYKGSRRSIGDNYEEQLSPYVNVEYSCQNGDQIYMFSDGYPDQFGGPLGKKFMKVGVQNMIGEIYDKTGEQQLNHVKENFENWLGDVEQIDDVLFMGIKL
ncbi:SpoIIE family protein phosphatase [Carboxylicivirga sp. A043]|uniref:two-component regulator propeller domain-containing protein n=1 Tax=Carboxylicivirga litoralis TaxID=2816963 RepID=UPI0021CB7B6F|nr:two-component regulator propeller domain-containing protein [Carboxylicivirga sp. A043]MCU4154869.1 SpoIIE family protein phosphatase [Carboxylicivirga sp. A043]